MTAVLPRMMGSAVALCSFVVCHLTQSRQDAAATTNAQLPASLAHWLSPLGPT